MNRNPLNATFELTTRCNLKCKMCLIRHYDNVIKKELSANQWINLGKQAYDCGTVCILITGGEPFLRSDFPHIYSEIYKMGFIITLYTNGTLLNGEIKEILTRYPPHRLGVTVYGGSPETYKKVCGTSSGFEKMIQSLIFFKTLPSVLNIRTTLIKDNINDYKLIEDIAQKFSSNKSLDVSRIVSKSIRGGHTKPEDCRLSPQENIDIIFGRARKAIKNKKLSNSDMIAIRNTSAAKSFRQSYLYGCAAAVNSYTITWDGKMLGCQILDDIYTNPIITSLADAWALLEENIEPALPNPYCSSCQYVYYCTACPALIKAETGIFSGKPEYICEDAKRLYDLVNSISIL
ncbi:MAG TPA: radical SAM protein [Clostridiales bacterium]|nr:radical SAM protein [Clostridiales bacterium]